MKEPETNLFYPAGPALVQPGRFLRFALLFCFALAFSACTSGTISEQEFDQTTWKDDPNGCKNLRQQLKGQVEAIRPRLIGMGTKEISRLMGRPDRIEIAERSQRFYIYYLNEGSQCQADSTKPEGDQLAFRFNPLDQVMEVTLVFGTGK